MNICVFCSSSDNLDSGCYTAAEALGSWIGENAHTLVYGGSEKGLMKACSHAAKKAGAKITAVVPPFVKESGLLNPDIDNMVFVNNLAERKAEMIRISDVFIALPGGIGTLDEVFSVAACNVVGECGKPVFVMNIGGIYQKLRELFAEMTDHKLIRPGKNGRISFVENTQELFDKAMFANSNGNNKQSDYLT